MHAYTGEEEQEEEEEDLFAYSGKIYSHTATL
jgi:hypothetical protein